MVSRSLSVFQPRSLSFPSRPVEHMIPAFDGE